MYDVKSGKAEEFINHEEIEDTLNYAKAHKNDRKLIDEILNKAENMKGISHREAAVLMECDLEDEIERMYELAKKIKQHFYGNRIVLFAPLYLSNYCVNGCVYCPYHYINRHIPRKNYPRNRFAKR